MKAPIFCHGTHKELHQIRMHLQQNQQLKENLQGSYQRAVFDWTCIQISIENVFYALEMHSFIMGFQQWASKK
jgi:hypothetical protein